MLYGRSFTGLRSENRKAISKEVAFFLLYPLLTGVIYLAAIQLISTFTLLGSVFTATVSRAGGFSMK